MKSNNYAQYYLIDPGPHVTYSAKLLQNLRENGGKTFNFIINCDEVPKLAETKKRTQIK